MAVRTVADIMTRDVVTLLEEDNLEQVASSLQRYRFHHLPVIDGRRVVGMLSQRDMLRATVAGRDHSMAALAKEARFLEQTFVRDVMRTAVVTVMPSESIPRAAKLLLTAGIGALPVVDGDGNLVGLVTEHDIVRQVAEGA